VLAGSLASFFRIDSTDENSSTQSEDEPTSVTSTEGVALVNLVTEVAALRRQVDVLTAHLVAGKDPGTESGSAQPP
jgi:hypothetical protein